MLKVYNLKVEYLVNPIGIDEKKPRFSWMLNSDLENLMQDAYEISAFEDAENEKIIWTSGKIQSSESQSILWEGPELESRQRVYWSVKVWIGETSIVSRTAFFEMGLLKISDWEAKWIELEETVDPDAYKPASYARRQFIVKKDLVSARAYMTSRGLYRFYINGMEGTDELFTPGYTSYYKRLQYQAYDITELLHEGENVWGVVLGDGWWRGGVGAFSFRNNFGYKVAYLGQIVLTYQDGSIEVVATGEDFKASIGAILKSDLKAGEEFDARANITGWNQCGFNDSNWKRVYLVDAGYDNLIASRSVPIRRKEHFTPEILNTPNGETVLDFGQNIAGWVEMSLEASPGHTVTLIHGETLDREGNFTLINVGVPADKMREFQTVKYIAKGNGIEKYQPTFAVFGFRYVLVENYPGELIPENFTAVAIYSDMQETGKFVCSNPAINQLVSNSLWSQKGNFLDVPTDCPTRERAGWTGDAQIYCRTASTLMNVYSFFEKWMADLSAEQYENGAIGITVPGVDYHNVEEFSRIMKKAENPLFPMVKPGEPGFVDGSAGWADAAVIIPWTMYLCYGDKNIINNQYESAKLWVDYMDSCAKDRNEQYKDTPAYNNYTNGELDAGYIWDTKFHFGEWLEADFSPDSQEEMNSVGAIDKILVATAYYAYSTRLLSEMAGVIGKTEDETLYKQRFEKIKRVYNRYLIKENGHILTNRQAPNVRTLAFGLADNDNRKAVAARLAELVKENNYHLNTGFLSTPFILHVLADCGYGDVAYRLLEQDTCPSWLYAVTKGATTIWESWTSISPDGDIAGSLNHYSYGAVCDFLFADCAGIQPLFSEPGYKKFIIKPVIGGSLSWVAAEYESIYGTIKSGWKKVEDKIQYQFLIPVNTKAMIILKGNETTLKIIQKFYPDAEYKDENISFVIGSGNYTITI